jgi:hypothetical protein
VKAFSRKERPGGVGMQKPGTRSFPPPTSCASRIPPQRLLVSCLGNYLTYRHSGLDPESSVFDSRWSLSRWKSGRE